jgi:uncharacterized membrane protein (UPF0127 family)
MKLYIPLIALGIFVILINFLRFPKPEQDSLIEDRNSNLRKFKIGNEIVLVEIADTPERQERGLSGRESLEEDHGMLFTYSSPSQVYFWMPDMKISIDIIYIKSGKVTQIVEKAPFFPSDYPKEKLPIYPSTGLVDMVLEVPAGFCEKNSIIVGTSAELIE